MSGEERVLMRWSEDSFAYWAEYQHNATPEKKLLVAVIERAICDYLSRPLDCTNPAYRKKAKRLRREAEAYLFSDSFSPWGFRWICDQLGDNGPILAARIRSGVIRLRRKGQRFLFFHPVHYLNPGYRNRKKIRA